jgi:hypothetical protein
MTSDGTVTVVDAVAAKVEKLRGKYERQGYEVIERPGPEEFPFDPGYRLPYRPAMLARRGDELHVFEVREAASIASGDVWSREAEFYKHPGWHFYVVSCDDVVPDDAPGIQGDPPSWPQLEHTAGETLRRIRTLPPWLQLLALWTVLEGVLQRIAVDHGIPVDLLSASTLISVLCDRGLIPRMSREPLVAAHEVHRLVRHGFDTPDEQVVEAVRTVSEWLTRLLPQPVERAA